MATLGAVVARNIRAERARRGWKQEELAAALGWSPSTISHLESGRRRVDVSDLPALCTALNVPLAALFHGADPGDLGALQLAE